ncbi:Hsp20/alpha crystallin family protein [Altibacter sp.]|uniref:Hsp20/alpha crystallin family protein n=1 Tax=Altibacter sp. TaxID=2024823 RepID=UPI00259127AA|nr:Hsp20/alpha crystallin family protein [Altibacter sp.]MCW9037889.1 Hsp20/alpha crystallin family protein [Altibacter sp.]
MKLMKRHENLFPNMWSPFNDDDWFRLPDTFKSGTSAPAVNILENEDDFKVEMAVPGMKKEDFNIDLENNLLTISAEEQSENETKGQDGSYTRREFNYSAFKRSFTLPDSVDGEKIAASYTDGVLNITIPKKEEAKPKPPKKIAIK